jgi:aryl-alcohol dehydrogenase (NADP+)
MTFGFQCDEPTSVAILDRAAADGITFIDTADVYPLGAPPDLKGSTEEIVGKWMKGRRHEVILATKCFGRTGPLPWEAGNSRKHILDAIDASLRRLQTDYIDLYQLHQPDPNTPIDETLGALDDLVRMGKIRYAGCSNFPSWRLAQALGRSSSNGWVRFDSAQPRYNLLYRQIERELLPLCDDEGVGVIPYNPIAGGMLSGKHARGEPTEGTRFTLGHAGSMYQGRYWHEDVFATVEQLQPMAAEAGMSLVQLAVAWVLANPVVTSPIIGASRPEQLDDSIRAVDTPLPADLKERLDELTAVYRKGDDPR